MADAAAGSNDSSRVPLSQNNRVLSTAASLYNAQARAAARPSWQCAAVWQQHRHTVHKARAAAKGHIEQLSTCSVYPLLLLGHHRSSKQHAAVCQNSGLHSALSSLPKPRGQQNATWPQHTCSATWRNIGDHHLEETPAADATSLSLLCRHVYSTNGAQAPTAGTMPG
jgi:hypothetical protein